MEQSLLTKCPIYLITGFLGSGKTTFVKNAIDYFDGKKKMAVIQNEFAPASFDGKELKRLTNRDFDLLEINNGSVFCVCLLSGFIQSLQNFIAKYQPEVILMEASGLSDPVGIGEIFNNADLQQKIFLAGSICIVDAQNFLKLETMQQRINHQIMIADHVIINKSDLTKELKRIISKIDKLNPLGKKYTTNYCDISFDEVFKSNQNSAASLQQNLFFLVNNKRPVINSIVFRSAKPVKSEKLEQFKNDIIKDVTRLKGYLKMDNGKFICIQTIKDEVSCESIESNNQQTELIVMGKDLEVKSFRQKYLKYV